MDTKDESPQMTMFSKQINDDKMLPPTSQSKATIKPIAFAPTMVRLFFRATKITVSFYGGSGSATLRGNNKGDGKDIIYFFENNDMIQITDTFSTTYNEYKKEIAFKINSTTSAITFKDFIATSLNIIIRHTEQLANL